MDDSPQTPDLARLGGDPQAWRALVDEYAGLVYAIARKHRLDADSCDDVAQAVFLALYRSMGSLRDADRLGAWIAQTTRRECWRLVRKRTREAARVPAAAPAEQGFLPDAQIEQLEMRHRLLASFDRLDPRCQALLRSLYSAGTESSYTQLAERLGMPIGSLGPTRQRCLAKLAQLMEGPSPTGLRSDADPKVQNRARISDSGVSTPPGHTPGD